MDGKLVAVVAINAALLFTCGAGLAADQPVMSQELAIDRNCSQSLFKQAFLAAAPSNASRFFWTGQRYAVEREVKKQLDSMRMRRIDDLADKKIAAIEAQRDRAMGLPAIPNDPELNRQLAESDRMINQFDQEILASTREWAAKCTRVVDEKLRLLDASK